MLVGGINVVTYYHMTYTLTRTSMALDHGTLKALKDLAQEWGVSKAEVMRRAVRKAKEEAECEKRLPEPMQALDWLQEGGLSVKEAAAFRAEVKAERNAKRYWWEA